MIYETKNYKVVYDFLIDSKNEVLNKIFYFYEVYCKSTNKKLKEGCLSVRKIENTLFNPSINAETFIEKNLILRNNNFSLHTHEKLKCVVACCVYEGRNNYLLHEFKPGIGFYEYDEKNNVYIFTEDRITYKIIRPNGTVVTHTIKDAEPYVYLFDSENIFYQLLKIENKIAFVKNLNTDELIQLSYKGVTPNLKKLGNRKTLFNSLENFYFETRDSLFRINFKELKMERMKTSDVNRISLSTFFSPYQWSSLLKKKDCFAFIKIHCYLKKDKSYCSRYIYKDKIVTSIDKVGMSLPFCIDDKKTYYFDNPVKLNLTQLGLENIKITNLNRSGNFEIISFMYSNDPKIHNEVFNFVTMESYGLDLQVNKNLNKESSIETKKKLIKIKLN